MDGKCVAVRMGRATFHFAFSFHHPLISPQQDCSSLSIAVVAFYTAR